MLKDFFINAEFVETRYVTKSVKVRARNKKEALELLTRGDYYVVTDNIEPFVVDCYQMDVKHEPEFLLDEEDEDEG